MDFGLKDRVALVAAASRGIGYAAALELAREGARVFLCSRDETRASAAAQKIHEETGANVAGIAMKQMAARAAVAAASEILTLKAPRLPEGAAATHRVIRAAWRTAYRSASG